MNRYGKQTRAGMMAVLVLWSLLTTAVPVRAANVIEVTTFVDGVINDSDCSLREAVVAANENVSFNGCPAGAVGPDTIRLDPGVYQLLVGTGDDTARQGDLDILESLTIIGAGAGLSTVAASGIDRVFHLVQLGPDQPVRIQDMTISGGGGVNHGGAILNWGSRLELMGVEIANNSTSPEDPDAIGGAVSSELFGYVPSLAIVNSTIRHNTSHSGGGIYSEGTLRIERSLIWANTALTSGGGLDNNFQSDITNTTALIISSTFSGNGANKGTGIMTAGGLSIYSSTIYGNVITGVINADSVGVLVNNGGLNLKNTIVVKHTHGNCGGDSAVTSNGYNMADDTTCGLSAAKYDKIGDPLLLALASNGGPTMTHALPSNSPAKDAGTNVGCPFVDQRFYARPVNGGNGLRCDIGAFEFNSYLLELPEQVRMPIIKH